MAILDIRGTHGSGKSWVVHELLRRHPVLGDLRLLKTDTDGWDVMLVPALARSFAGSRPRGSR